MEPPTLSDVSEIVALLRELVSSNLVLVTEVQGLRADWQHPRLWRADDAEPLAIALASAVGDRAFAARETIEHAKVDETLRRALEAADLSNARQLGKFFAEIEGQVRSNSPRPARTIFATTSVC
jgi:hypothetical protein